MKKIVLLMTMTLLATLTTENAVFAKKLPKEKSKVSSKREQKEERKRVEKAQSSTKQKKRDNLSKKSKEDRISSKKELREWTERKNRMQPLQLKDLIEENHKLKTKNGTLQEENGLNKDLLAKLRRLKCRVDALLKQCNGEQPEGTVGRSSGAGDLMEGSDVNTQEDFWPEDDYASLDILVDLKRQQAAVSTTSESKGVRSIGRYGYYQGTANPDDLVTSPDDLRKGGWDTGKNGVHHVKGLVFKVQIGAYRKRNLAPLLEGEGPEGVFEQEQLDGVNTYTLGQFRNYWKADAFKKELRAMGLKDAWVVAFEDGERVPLKKVLKEVIRQK